MKSKKKTEKTRSSKYSNLTTKERKVMQELQSRNDIVITNAEKGGAVVILDVEDYVKEAERQLKNKENYRKIICDLLLLTMKLSTKLYQDFQKKTY